MLDDLRYKRTQDEQYLNVIKGIMHPIRRTPPEIWAEIFILTLPQQWQLAFKARPIIYRKAVFPGMFVGDGETFL
jgi:hypothetical protein